MTSRTTPITSWLTEDQPDCAVGNRGYVICAIPRSGSYFLCDLLRSTGKLGRPHEYFGADALRRLGMPDYPFDLPSQLAMARKLGATSNGIFGAKLFPKQMRDQAPGAIYTGLSQPRLIYLQRGDLLGQAISLTRAAQTSQYFAKEGPPQEPPFDAALIRDYLELIVRWHAAWQQYFARLGIEPLRLTYEDVVAEPEAAVRAVASFMQVEGPIALAPDQLVMAVQRDSVSSEWRTRFLTVQPANVPMDMPRTESMITLQRRIRRVLRMAGLRRD